MGTWVYYFSVTQSIASALTGLIFVALSINLKKILSITKAKLPSRAIGSLTLLMNIVIVSNLCMVPNQPLPYLGTEIVILGAIIWVTISRLDFITYKTVDDLYKKPYFRNLFFLQFSILPFVIGGGYLMFGNTTGFYFLIPGIIFSLLKSVLDTWYLTVEISS